MGMMNGGSPTDLRSSLHYVLLLNVQVLLDRRSVTVIPGLVTSKKSPCCSLIVISRLPDFTVLCQEIPVYKPRHFYTSVYVFVQQHSVN